MMNLGGDRLVPVFLCGYYFTWLSRDAHTSDIHVLQASSPPTNLRVSAVPWKKYTMRTA